MFLKIFLAAALLALANTAAETATNEVSFSRDIAPILSAKCLTCHNSEKSKGKYRVHTFESLNTPGSSGETPILAGDAEKSELFRRLTTTDEDDRMPQKDEPLSEQQIELFRAWIATGAKLDKGEGSTLLTMLVPKPPHPVPPEVYAHPVPVLALAFNPSGTEVAASGYHEVLVCDLEGKLLRRITNVVQRVHALAFHPDGKSLIVVGGQPGRGGEASVYDYESGRFLRTLVQASDELLALALSPDGAVVAIGGTDNAIHVIDWGKGKEEPTIQQHSDWVMDLEFSPDGRRIASASRDRTARVYDASTGDLVTTYVSHAGPVFSVAFINNEKVASAGRDKAIHLWKIEDGKKEGEIGGFTADILKLHVAGDQIFSTSGKRILQHKLSDKSLINTVEDESGILFSLALDSAKNQIASGSYSGRVRISDGSTAKINAMFSAAPISR